jgi:hypothetical protein
MCTFSIITAIACIAFVVKNFVAYNHRGKIYDAISRYRSHCYINQIEPIVNYADVEDYDTTWLRLWDWSNKRILPKEKFEAIKPYIR